jgi:small subunit ribosomal protein S5
MSDNEQSNDSSVDGKTDNSGKLNPKQGKRQQRRPSGEKKVSPVLPESDFEERVVSVNRCAKVVKGGRRFSFSALLVLGDKKGRVGFGLGKAKEVPEAIRKAKMAAQKKLIKVSLDKGTIPHEALGLFDASKIIFKPAAEGTGVKAAGACRAVLELAGIKNILTKSLRGTNPHNVVKATFYALKSLRTSEEIALARGKEKNNIRIKV